MPGGEGGPKLEDSFVLPSSSVYAIKQDKTEEGVKGTLTRTVAAGATIENDVVLKGAKGPLTSNKVAVTKLADGRMEYVETLTWTAGPGEFAETPAELRLAVKKAIPERAATTEVIDAATTGIKRTIWKIFFGPGDPLIPLLVFHPDLGAKRMMQRVFKEADPNLQAELGDKMDAATRAEFIKNFVTALNIEEMMAAKQKQKQNPAESTGDDKGALVSMLFSVKVPGKVLETNGEVDPITGEVVWAFYGEAAQPAPVQMRVVYQP